VRDLTFQVEAGELWCLLGPNGAGKTTLLHTIVGLREPERGAIALDGRAVGDWLPGDAARTRAFLPQSLHDAFSASVLESVMLGRHPYLSRWDWEDDDERARASAALTAVDLAGLEARDVLSLSGGERQRVALATVFVQDAPLMLLDEPVAHLDLRHQVMVLDYVRGVVEARRAAAVFTVHDLNLAARYASHVLVFAADGAVVRGTVADVMNEANLERAFGHGVTRVQLDGRAVFIPE
jgi:iron complex transport system ATP-binding protein